VLQPIHRYPTDLGLLSLAIFHTEKILNALYEERKIQIKNKPIPDRNIARKDYLALAKQREIFCSGKIKLLRKQLQYLKKNLAHIQGMPGFALILNWRLV
jgi:transcription initiation factor IIE alpha subunit